MSMNIRMNKTDEHEDLNQRRPYVLMTAAYNEEAHIGETITSVLSQTHPPERWVIVSDGSTDGTNQIVERYVREHRFIHFQRMRRPPGRAFSSKVIALHSAARLLEGASYEFIGNLDADVSVNPSYFEQLIARFESDPELGVASGFVLEEAGGQFRSRSSNRVDSVPHAAQLVRRACYEAIGGYAVLKYGGEDWYAQTSARMHRWKARAFPELSIFHHRHTGTGTNLLKDRFRLGRLDYSFGSHPLFEILKCFRRIPEWPFCVGAMQRLMGYTWCYICGERRAVPDEIASFLRSEQKGRLLSLLIPAWTSRNTPDELSTEK